MKTKFRNGVGRVLGNRAAVVTAGTIGFLLGATGFVAAQQGADDPAPVTTLAAAGTTAVTTDTRVDDSTATTTVETTNLPAITVNVAVPDPTDDRSTSAAAAADGGSTSVPTTTATTIDDNDTATSTTIDDNDTATSTTIDDNDNDNDTSTSVQRALPAAFTETYRSSGGSISVSWSGTALSISSINPAAGFVADIEDNSWDNVRVDFEPDDDDLDDARIEVRLHEGTIRVRIG